MISDKGKMCDEGFLDFYKGLFSHFEGSFTGSSYKGSYRVSIRAFSAPLEAKGSSCVCGPENRCALHPV